jgi:hypothetical protein
VRACRQYAYALPQGATKTGRFEVAATLPSGTERRTAAYR